MTREELFLSCLPLIERVVGWVAARRGLRGADAEDFESTVKSRLVESDYAALARFEGRSSLKTYLTAVINRLYLDFQVQRFGKWRPSAEARRLGPLAVRLECLLLRDGLTFEEACGVLASDTRLGATRDALEALRLRLPPRPVRGGAGDRSVPVSTESGDVAVERAERQALAERTFSAIRRSLGRLPPRDRVFLRLHVESGLTVAEAARALGHEQKALYRKKEEILKRLRADLEAEGVFLHDARELLSTLDWDAALGPGEPEDGAAAEKSRPRPSQDESRTAGWKGEA
ncbi:MAG TPA: sigma-70 family RNA polymerase sigma factor [Vicinamibacteria bacterium]